MGEEKVAVYVLDGSFKGLLSASSSEIGVSVLELAAAGAADKETVDVGLC